MSVKNWWSNTKAKAKTWKKTAGKWVGIALAALLVAAVVWGIFALVKRSRQQKELAQLNAEVAALSGGSGRMRWYKDKRHDGVLHLAGGHSVRPVSIAFEHDRRRGAPAPATVPAPALAGAALDDDDEFQRAREEHAHASAVLAAFKAYRAELAAQTAAPPLACTVTQLTTSAATLVADEPTPAPVPVPGPAPAPAPAPAPVAPPPLPPRLAVELDAVLSSLLAEDDYDEEAERVTNDDVMAYCAKRVEADKHAKEAAVFHAKILTRSNADVGHGTVPNHMPPRGIISPPCSSEEEVPLGVFNQLHVHDEFDSDVDVCDEVVVPQRIAGHLAQIESDVRDREDMEALASAVNKLATMAERLHLFPPEHASKMMRRLPLASTLLSQKRINAARLGFRRISESKYMRKMQADTTRDGEWVRTWFKSFNDVYPACGGKAEHKEEEEEESEEEEEEGEEEESEGEEEESEEEEEAAARPVTIERVRAFDATRTRGVSEHMGSPQFVSRRAAGRA